MSTCCRKMRQVDCYIDSCIEKLTYKKMNKEEITSRLPESALRAVEKARGQAKPKILFVCLGNICRSPAAEGVMRSMAEQGGGREIEVDSAGTGAYHIGDLPDRRMRVHALRRGYELTHRARQVKESDFDEFDLIVGMDNSNLRNLHNLAPTPEGEAKIVRMIDFVDLATRYDHIPDPYYEGSEGFELVLDLLENGLGNLYNLLKG